MNPTLKDKQVVIVKKFNIELSHNDIVVIKKNNKTIIKRIVAIPTDKIKIDQYVYVNNKKIDNLETENPGKAKELITLGENEYFVLGDNRQNSIDSRFDEIGIINKNEIIGKIIFK